MTKTILKASVLLAMGTALSGCLLTGNKEFNEAARDAAQLLIDNQGVPIVDSDDMPDTGSAEYVGIASVNYDQRLDIGNENNDYYADIAFSADFETSEVTGSMTNFQSPDGAVDGELELEGGEIVGAGVDGDFVGTITDQGDDIQIELDVDGFFRGDGTGEPSSIIGEMDGDFVNGDETGNVFGSFVAEIAPE